METAYQKQFERHSRGGPSWLVKLRQNGMDRFLKLGFPTPDLEEWRFTNVRPLVETAFEAATEEGLAKITPDQMENLKHLPLNPMEGCDLVFVNGHFSPRLSSIFNLPRGVRVESLKRVLREEPERVEPFLGRLSAIDQQPFAALNTAFIDDGAYVFLPKGTSFKHPIHLVFLSYPNGQATLSHPRNLIVLEDFSEAAVVESHVGLGKTPYFNNPLTEISLGEAARLEHYKLQGESEAAFHFSSADARIKRAARFTSHAISLGARLSRSDLHASLDAEGSECSLNGLYLAAGSQHVDHHTVIDHACPHGLSEELYKGILSEKAHGVFDGKIIVRPGASKTQARQTNKNLLLSDDAVVNTKPLLEIFNNDVKCNHGATIGRLDLNQIFYLRSRGVSEERAKNMLTTAFAGDVLSQMKIRSIRARLEEMISIRLMRGRRISEGA